MKNVLLGRLLVAALILVPAIVPSAQAAARSNGTTAALWQRLDLDAAKSSLGESDFKVRRGDFSVFQLDEGALEATIAAAPLEFTTVDRSENYQVLLPMPDGTLQAFRVWESPIMEAGLAREFPEIKTFIAQGVDDPTATARLDRTPAGFHGMVISASGTVYIDPYRRGDTSTYISYNKSGLKRHAKPFQCLTDELDQPNPIESLDKAGDGRTNLANAGTLRTYRLAMACTGEYAAFHGGTVAGATSAIATTVNRVNTVYERDFSVRLVIIANNSQLIFTNASTDPYTNTDGSAMLGQNQTAIDSRIGNGGYDIGHVVSTGGGGVAYLRSVCNSSNKAGGVTGSSSPVGDGFDIDYVAHEMGHQFGGNHTFNSTQGSCGGGNKNTSTAYETGSGTTIMAYAGICGTDDVQPHSDDFFHGVSYDEILAHITGAANACSQQSATGDTAPANVNAGANFTVPISTPFALTGSATDVNGDALTYTWEEWDLGTSTTTKPVFRPRLPSTNPTRTFPQMSDILAGSNATTWEATPSVARSMKFRLTVRDNHAGGGGVGDSGTSTSSSTTDGYMTVTTASGTTAFSVTAPNTAVSWAGNSSQTVSWNVGGTGTGTTVNCANVKVSVSTDGGANWTTVLASTPNDGSEAITVPNTPSSTCRVKVEAVGNIFFDVSNANFTITPGGSCTYSISPTSSNPGAGATTGSVSVTAGAGCSWTASSNAAFLTITSGASGSGNGTVGYSVAANTGAARSGSLTIAGQTFTVNQADGTPSCSYSISPTSSSPGAAATTGSVSVTAGTGCTWTATSNASFLTITSGASGSGNGTVGYSVAANTGAARNGTLTIAGQTFTVNQAAGTTGCSSDNASIAVGTPANGTLATTDCTSTIRTGGRYYDNFTFAATAGTAYTITMNSTAFDTYLHLLSGGVSVAFDDDGNGGTNSKITYTPSASGNLTVHATSYSAGSTGAYTVSVTGASGPVTILSEGAESGATGWTVSTNTTGNNWVVSANGRRTGTNGFRSNNATATYPNNLDQSLVSPAFSLAGRTAATLSYYYKQQTETSYDFFKVEVSTNGGTSWTNLSNVSTNSTGFTTTAGSGMVAKTISLNTYAGQANVMVRFRLTSDVSVVFWGVAVDDILVTAQ